MRGNSAGRPVLRRGRRSTVSKLIRRISGVFYAGLHGVARKQDQTKQVHIRGLLWHSARPPPTSANAGPSETTGRLRMKQKEEVDSVFADTSFTWMAYTFMRTSRLMEAAWCASFRFGGTLVLRVSLRLCRRHVEQQPHSQVLTELARRWSQCEMLCLRLLMHVDATFAWL